MKTLPIPHQYDQLISYTYDLIEGLKKHETQLGLQQNTAASLVAVMDTAKAAEQDFQGSRAIPGNTLSPAQRDADAAAKRFILTAKKIFGTKLGDQWSPAWAEVGYVNGSLATPTKIGERESLLFTISQYLTAHPDFASTELEITAARATQLHEELRAARAARKNYTLEHKTKKEVRKVALATLRKHLSWTISDLKRVMSADDLRWHSFGLVTRNPSSITTLPVGEPASAPGAAVPPQPVLLPDPAENNDGDNIAEITVSSETDAA